MSGQISSSRYLSENDAGGGDVLPLSDDVMAQLREKNPSPQEARLGYLLFGPVEDVPDSIYQQINGEMVLDAALRTKGSRAPSGAGVGANGLIKVIQEVWNRTVRSNSRNDQTLVH